MASGYTPGAGGYTQNQKVPMGLTTVQSGITSSGGYPSMPAFETMFDPVTGKFKYGVQKQNFDVVTPWQKLANEQVQTGYNKALGANVAGAQTGYKQASEGLAMSGGVSPQQMARLAQRSGENKLLQDQMARQQLDQNQLNVNLLGEEMKQGQEKYLGQAGLQTDIANQQAAVGSVGDLNEYVTKLVEDMIKKQMGKDVGGAL